MPRKQPDLIDALVGRNVRVQRLRKGLSQEKLAALLGITFQQVQKYERGVNRIGSGRLYRISRIFDIPLTALFEGSEAEPGTAGSMLDLLADPHSMRLVQAMAEIADTELRRSIVQLVERIVSSQPAAERSVKRRAAAHRG